MFIALKPLGVRRLSADQIIARLRGKLAGVPGAPTFLQAVQDLRIGGRASNAQYQYTLQGENVVELNQWAPRVVDRLRALPTLVDLSSDQQDRGRQSSVVIDRVTASRFGISPQLIDDTLYDAFGQRQVSNLYTQLNQYHVVMEVAPVFWQYPDRLSDLYVRSPTGVPVPLSTFAHYEPSFTALAVNHQSQFPSVTVSFNLPVGAALGDAVQAVQGATRELGLPQSIRGSFQGTAQAFQASLANQPLLILAALAAVYIVLGVLYESYVHPLTILSTLPSAGIGAILALLVSGIELTVIALIGIILLIGIVKKNAIMMIDFALEAERRDGKSPEAAIFEACLLRFRPIMMTTMAALLGALPLALGTGVGSELRRPLGIAIVGGLIMSQMLTLYTTPVVYLYLDWLRLRLARRRAPVAPLVPRPDSRWPARRRRAFPARRLHGGAGLRPAVGCHPRHLQGERRLEGRRAPRSHPARKRVGALRRPAAQRARGAGEHLQPESAGGRSDLPAGARPGAAGPGRVLPDRDRRRRLHALPSVADPRHLVGRRHLLRQRPVQRAGLDLPAPDRRLLDARLLGPRPAHGGIGPGQRPGQRGRSRDRPSLLPGGAGPGLLPAPDARRAAQAPGRHRDRVRHRAAAHQE